MKATVQLVYDDEGKNRHLEVTIKGSPKGQRAMNAIDKAVEWAASEDKDWRRWNLISIVD